MGKLRIFISSPGDVGYERKTAEQVIRRVNAELSGRVTLEPYFWEHEPMHAGSDFQGQIPPPAEFDIFIGILWSRLGTRLHSQHARGDGTGYRSGTEYEFETALEAYRLSVRKVPRILIYRRTEIPSFPAEPRDVHAARQKQWETLGEFIAQCFTDTEDGGTFKAAFNSYEHTAEFEERLEAHLRKVAEEMGVESISDPVPAATESVWKAGSPYRGLKVFDFAHAPVFFGRTRAIDQVIRQLRDRANKEDRRAFVMIFGGSGSGKSSLLQAGVVPALVAGGVDGIGLWRRALMQPGQSGGDLFEGLATALLQSEAVPELAAGGCTTGNLAAMLRESPGGVGLLLAGALPQIAQRAHEAEKGRLQEQAASFVQAGREADASYTRQLVSEMRFPEPRLILGIDQMEEMFTLSDRFTAENRQGFIRALGSLAQCGYVWVATTLRSDFYARCAELPELVTLAAGSGQYHLLPPNGTELGQMIRLPAQAAGVGFEDDKVRGRLEDVLRDASVNDPASLPLLEFTLEQLFEAGAQRRRLTHADYDGVGAGHGAGLRGVLIRAADEVWEKLPPPAQSAFPAVFRRLATLGTTENEPALRFSRRAVLLPPEGAAGGERTLIDAFLQCRLLVVDADNSGRQFVSVAHEALLNEWPRLRRLLEGEAVYLRRRTRVSVAAADWEREGRPLRRLATGVGLAEAREVLATERPHLTALELQYAATSLRRNRRRTVGLLVGAAALVLVFAALAVWASLAARSATRRRQEVQGLLAASDFTHGEELVDADDASDGLVYLTRAMESDPSGVGGVAADRLWFLLTQRAWPVPVSPVIHHGSAILSASFSPDGKRVVTASGDGTARLWDAQSGLPLGHPMDHGKPVRRAIFSPDGRRLLTGCFDGKVRIWNVEGSEPVCRWQAEHEDVVNSAAVSPHGRWAATGARDGTVRLWEVESGRRLAELREPENVHSLAFHPSDDTLLLTASGRTARLWELPAGKPLAVMSHDGTINSARFSPDGKWIVTAGDDGSARVWNIAGDPTSIPLELRHGGEAQDADFRQGQTVSPRAIRGSDRSEGVQDAFFSPDGSLLATVSDAQVRLWTAAGAPLLEHPIQREDAVTAVHFSPDSLRVVIGGTNGRIQTWAARTGEPLGEPIRETGATVAVEFAPDGQRVLVTTAEGAARVWRAAPFHPNATPLAQGAPVEDLALDANGRRLAVACGNGNVQLWDLTHRPAISRTLAHPAAVLCVAFSPDGRWLATGSADSKARIWTVDSPDDAAVLLPAGAPVCAVAFRPDGGCLATATEAGVARCWRVPDGQAVGKPMVHADRITALSFSGDGRKLATASTDHTARIWQADTGEPCTRPLSSEREMTCAAFSPVANVVATGSRDGTAQLWNAATGKPQGPPLPHRGAVLTLAFDRSGDRLATGSEDGTAVLWNLANSQPVCAALTHPFAVDAVAFSPDGTRLATTTADGAARLWDTQGGRAVSGWMRHTQPIRGLVFSPDGRRLFTGSTDRMVHAWDIAGLRGGDRRQLAWLARTLSAVHLQPESGRLETHCVPPESAMREEGARFGTGNPEKGDSLAAWFFADPTHRLITPSGMLALPAYIETRLAEGTPSALDEAALLAGDDVAMKTRIERARKSMPIQ